MAPIVAKRKVADVPIPVIGLGSAPESDSLEIDSEDKLNRIAVSAYYKAEARGYEPGHEMQDWLDAEAEIMGKTNEEKFK